MTGFSDSHLKIPLILAILIFMSSLNFCNSFVTSGPGTGPIRNRLLPSTRKWEITKIYKYTDNIENARPTESTAPSLKVATQLY